MRYGQLIKLLIILGVVQIASLAMASKDSTNTTATNVGIFSVSSINPGEGYSGLKSASINVITSLSPNSAYCGYKEVFYKNYRFCIDKDTVNTLSLDSQNPPALYRWACMYGTVNQYFPACYNQCPDKCPDLQAINKNSICTNIKLMTTQSCTIGVPLTSGTDACQKSSDGGRSWSTVAKSICDNIFNNYYDMPQSLSTKSFQIGIGKLYGADDQGNGCALTSSVAVFNTYAQQNGNIETLTAGTQNPDGTAYFCCGTSANLVSEIANITGYDSNSNINNTSTSCPAGHLCNFIVNKATKTCMDSGNNLIGDKNGNCLKTNEYTWQYTYYPDAQCRLYYQDNPNYQNQSYLAQFKMRVKVCGYNPNLQYYLSLLYCPHVIVRFSKNDLWGFGKWTDTDYKERELVYGKFYTVRKKETYLFEKDFYKSTFSAIYYGDESSSDVVYVYSIYQMKAPPPNWPYERFKDPYDTKSEYYYHGIVPEYTAVPPRCNFGGIPLQNGILNRDGTINQTQDSYLIFGGKDILYYWPEYTSEIIKLGYKKLCGTYQGTNFATPTLSFNECKAANSSQCTTADLSLLDYYNYSNGVITAKLGQYSDISSLGGVPYSPTYYVPGNETCLYNNTTSTAQTCTDALKIYSQQYFKNAVTTQTVPVTLSTYNDTNGTYTPPTKIIAGTTYYYCAKYSYLDSSNVIQQADNPKVCYKNNAPVADSVCTNAWKYRAFNPGSDDGNNVTVDLLKLNNLTPGALKQTDVS